MCCVVKRGRLASIARLSGNGFGARFNEWPDDVPPPRLRERLLDPSGPTQGRLDAGAAHTLWIDPVCLVWPTPGLDRAFRRLALGLALQQTQCAS